MNRSTILTTLSLLASTALAQDPKAPPSTGPAIAFEMLIHDYGTMTKGAKGECRFVYTNTGNEPLIISQCQSSCGCVVPYCEREPLAPGRSAAVRVKYDTNRIGPINKSVTITSNATNTPVVILRIKGTVLPSDTTTAPLAIPAIPER